MDLKLGRFFPSGNQRSAMEHPLVNGGLSIATFDYCRVSKLYFGVWLIGKMIHIRFWGTVHVRG
jgi:hypothetical protein